MLSMARRLVILGGHAAAIDPLAPDAPSIDLVAGSDTGSSSTDDITTDTTPDIDITFTDAVEDDVIEISDNGAIIVTHSLTAGEVAANAWTAGATPLAAGLHVLKVRQTRDGHISQWSATLTITVDATAPTISTASTANCVENATLAITLAADETVAWTLTGGADQARFEISSTTLRWASNGTKNYEAPDDADTNNTYVVQVTATDTAGNATNKTITVTVTDVDDTAPTISTVAFSSSAGADNTYVAGNNVEVTVTFTENVTVTGTPQLTINVGGSNKVADYLSGTGSAAQIFRYTVQGGDTDANGISIVANSLALNSGTIRDAASNNATLTHSAVSDNASHKVDTTAPTISGALSPADGATSVAVGANFVMTFSEAIAAGAAASFRLTETGVGLVEELDETHFGTKLVISGSVLTINWTADLDPSTAYDVQWDAGSVTDLAGNPLAASSGATDWNVVTAAGGAWSPADVTTAFWYDASDAATVHTTGGLADTWDDKSGNSRTASASGDARPNDEASIINGLHAIDFYPDGALRRSMSTASFSISQPFTIFAVIRTYSDQETFGVLVHDGAAAVYMFTRRQDLSDKPAIYGGTDNMLASTGALAASTNMYFYGTFNGNTNSRAKVSGVAEQSPGTGPGTTNFTGGLVIGGNAVSTDLQCHIGEIFCIPSATGTDISNALAYLNSKWGV